MVLTFGYGQFAQFSMAHPDMLDEVLSHLQNAEIVEDEEEFSFLYWMM